MANAAQNENLTEAANGTLSRKRSLKVVERPKPEKIRVELNIERWPAIWQPAKSKNKPHLRVFERETKLEDGSRIVSRVEISFNHLGTLSTEEQKMFYALIKHWEDQGRPAAEVFFSDRILARILQKGWGSNVIESLTKSLRKLRTISLEWINSYHDKTQTGVVLRQRHPFTILAQLKIIERAEEGAVNSAKGYFKFDDHILSNLLANYTKPFLIEEFFKIKTDIGLLLYNHLDLILANKQRYERCTKELFEDLGLKNADYQFMHKRKRALEGPLRELASLRISSGVISRASIEKTSDKKDYKIVVEKSASSKLELGEAEIPVSQLIVEQPGQKVVINDYRVRDEAALQAEELVHHFHKVFHGVENHSPQSKELGQATALIAKHGLEQAKHVVDYAFAKARETGFQVQHFGAVLNYVARAVADFDRWRQNEQKAQKAIEHQTRQLEEEEAKQARGEARLNALTPEQYQARFEQAKADLFAEFPKLQQFIRGRQDSKIHEGMIRSRMIRDLDQEEMDLLMIPQPAGEPKA